MVFTGLIGQTDGVSNNAKGGWKETSNIPKQMVIWNRTNLDGRGNLFEHKSKEISVRSAIKLSKADNKRFFAAISHNEKSFEVFFKWQPKCEWTIRKTFYHACNKLNIVGLETKDSKKIYCKVQWELDWSKAIEQRLKSWNEPIKIRV